MEAIEKWLNSPKGRLADGHTLLKEHGTQKDCRAYLNTRLQDRKHVLTGMLSRILLEKQRTAQKDGKKQAPSLSGKLKAEFPDIIFDRLPEKLQLLVIKRYSLWETAKDEYENQQKAETAQERFEHAKAAIEAYAENNEIWDELNHFQSYRKILGRSRHFRKDPYGTMLEKLQKELNTVELIKELTKKLKNLRGEIGRHAKQGSEEKRQSAIVKYNKVAAIIDEPSYSDAL